MLVNLDNPSDLIFLLGALSVVVVFLLIFIFPRFFTTEVERVVVIGDQALTEENPLPNYGPVPADLQAKVEQFYEEERHRKHVEKRITRYNQLAGFYILFIIPIIFGLFISNYADKLDVISLLFAVPFFGGLYFGFIIGRFSGSGIGVRSNHGLLILLSSIGCAAYTISIGGMCGLVFLPASFGSLLIGLFPGHLIGAILNPAYPD